jgi:Tfp pilus assembly protein FimV
MSIELPTNQQSATPQQLDGTSPGVSSSSVVPPSEQAVPAAPATPPAAASAPAAQPDMQKIIETARGQMPISNAYGDRRAETNAATAEAKLEKQPHAELIAAYVQQFNTEKRDALAELVAITNEFNQKPTGKLVNTLKTEFLLSKMTTAQIGQIPTLIDEGVLAFTNEDAFRHTKQHRREMKAGADAPIVEVALLKHAIAAASMNGQYGVVSNILSTTTNSPLRDLENTFRDIEAQGALNSPVTGKPYADILNSGVRQDINAIAQDIAKINEAKAKQQEEAMAKLQAEAEAENAARDAAAKAAQAQTNAPQAAAPQAPAAEATTSQAAEQPQSPAPQATAPEAPAQASPSWQQTVNRGPINPAALSPVARPPIIPGR